jgi:hypothetical protein
MITNLKEFIHHVGGDTAYQAGRGLYKYTGCGPWIVYLVEATPKRSTTLQISVRIKDKKLHASVEESLFDHENEQAPEALSLLGFSADGSPRRGDKIGRTLDAYRRSVENFLEKGRVHGESNTIGNSRNPYKLTLHPPHQHELGMGRGSKQVCITLHRIEEPSYREVYYESDEANTLAECAGIKMGSIVEGSEAYVDGDPMMFPFTGEEFDKYVQGIDDEASFFWERDNLDHYRVKSGKKEFWIKSGWGRELTELPKKLRETVVKFLQTNDLEEDKPTIIPATKIEIEKLSTDDWGY